MEQSVILNLVASLESRYRDASPESQEYFRQGRTVMCGAAKGAYFYKPYPLTMERGESCYLYDVDGRQFVDFANHHTSQILGHQHPAVMEAVQRQLARGIVLGAPVGIEAELSAEMCRRVQSLERIRFCNSGTEATLHAIRLARGFSGRPKIAKFEGGYHGSHDVVEISVSPPLDQAGPESTPHSVPTAGGLSPHVPQEVVVLPYDDIDAVERLVSKHCHELACVIFDPKAGILPQRRDFVRALRKITRKNDVLLILDEIVAFRVGPGGFQDRYEITPDLTTYGKCVGGGFPVGALGGRAQIMDLFDNTNRATGFFQSGTFSAHPVTMAAGLATLKQMTPDAFVHLNSLGEQLCTGLNELFDDKCFSAQVVGIGSLFSIHLTHENVTNYRSLARSDKSLVHPIFLSLLEQGFFLSHTLAMNALSLPMDSSHVTGLINAMEQTLDRVRSA